MSRLEPCPDRCNVLLVGGGGREHALAWKLKQSPRLGRLWLTSPRNAGLATLGEPGPHAWDPRNVFQIQRWCEREAINLIVSRCTELESGGRMIDTILTNTVLPSISTEFLQRMLEGQTIQKVHVSVKNESFHYAFD